MSPPSAKLIAPAITTIGHGLVEWVASARATRSWTLPPGWESPAPPVFVLEGDVDTPCDPVAPFAPAGSVEPVEAASGLVVVVVDE